MSYIKQTIKSITLNFAPKLAKNYLFKEQAKFSWKTLSEINNEPEVLILEEFFAKHPNFVFVDVGCNKGEYTYAASKYLPPKNIYSFEPNPKLNSILKKIFRGINVFPYALSDTEGKAQFKVPFLNGNEDDSLGSLNTNTKETNETSHLIFDVECKRLDELVTTHKITKIDVIKIDVEGFELNMLNGAQNTISTFSPLLLIEIEKRHHPNKNVTEIIDSIKNSYNTTYKVFYFDNEKYQLLEVSKEPSQQQANWGTRKYINNFLFIPGKNVILDEITEINNKLDKLFANKKK